MKARTITARRGFLAALAGAVTVPAVAAAPVPSKATSAIAEAPELLTLGQRLDELGEAHNEAVEALTKARAEFARLEPPLPQGLIANPGDDLAVSRGVPRPNGGWVLRDDGDDLRIIDADRLARWAERHKIDGRTKVGRRVRQALALASKYEADVAEAKRAANLDACEWAAGEFAIRMQDLVDEILAVEPKTTVGIGIYARAVVAGFRILRYGAEPGYVERLGHGLAVASLRIRAQAR